MWYWCDKIYVNLNHANHIRKRNYNTLEIKMENKDFYTIKVENEEEADYELDMIVGLMNEKEG